MNINPASKIRIQCHALAIHSGSQNHLRIIILRNTVKTKRPNIPCHRHRYTLTGKIIPEQVCEIIDFANFERHFENPKMFALDFISETDRLLNRFAKSLW